MSIALELAAALYPWTRESPDYLTLANAIASMWSHVEQYILDQPDGTPAWCVVFDPDNCPTEALPFLAQVVGERLRTNLTDAQMRQWIKDRPNARRGTPEGIARAAQRSLTGGQVVQIFERTLPNGTADPDGDNFLVYTYESDTPDSAQVWQDLLTVIPGDMVCTYQVLTVPTWASIAAGESTWGAVETAYSTWTGVEGGTSGGTSW